MDYAYSDISKMIDHALLSPLLTIVQLEAGCQMALQYDVASVCITPYYVARCAELLSESSVKPSTVIGFPLGGHTTQIKEAEAIRAIKDGCEELDMVANISLVRSENWEHVRSDIQAVLRVAHDAGRKVKVIFENCYLTDQQMITLCEICSDLRVDWVKTSTGFGTHGATLEHVQLMRQHSATSVQVKAAGGVGDLKTLLQYREAGATRIGTSKTAALLDACREQLGLEKIESIAASSATNY